jgi:hypothetical protein
LKRFIGIIVAIIGVASLVLGVIFIIQSNSGKQELAAELKPTELSEVNAKYDAVKASLAKVGAAEEPQIQAGKAAPSGMYDYLLAQRALLGLAKSNIMLTGFVMMCGVVDIILGLGLILAGVAAICKKQTA